MGKGPVGSDRGLAMHALESASDDNWRPAMGA